MGTFVLWTACVSLQHTQTLWEEEERPSKNKLTLSTSRKAKSNLTRKKTPLGRPV